LSKIFKITVSENKKITENHYILTVIPSEDIMEPLPGQFFMVSAGQGMDPLLKRPFSLHRWLGGNFQMMYRVVGKATAILKDKSPGEMLDVIGPLGNGFQVAGNGEKMPILVAGGIGVAPIFALAESLSRLKPEFFYGARTGGEILCAEELKSLGINTVISTDDGTSGEKGSVVDQLNNFLSLNSRSADSYRLYACGPKPMLRSLSLLAKKYKIGGLMALEESMACGIGSCLGCVVNTTSGYKRVCKEGPVFPLEDIIW